MQMVYVWKDLFSKESLTFQSNALKEPQTYRNFSFICQLNLQREILLNWNFHIVTNGDLSILLVHIAEKLFVWKV